MLSLILICNYYYYYYFCTLLIVLRLLLLRLHKCHSIGCARADLHHHPVVYSSRIIDIELHSCRVDVMTSGDVFVQLQHIQQSVIDRVLVVSIIITTTSEHLLCIISYHFYFYLDNWFHSK